MLRLIIDKGNAPPQTGIGIYSSELLKALKQYNNGAVSVSESFASLNGTTLRPLKRVAYFWNLKKAAYRDFDNANVVHFTNVYVPPRHSRVAYIGTIHDLDAIFCPEGYSRTYQIYFRNIIAKTLSRADMIFTDSSTVRDSILDFCNISAERVKALGIGLSEEFMRIANQTEAVRENTLPTILFLGTLSLKKNIPWLINNIAQGIRSGALPRLRLILAGNAGFGFKQIANALKEAGDLVEWLKGPDIKQVAYLYQNANLVILPSRAEGFGITLLEAMYCKKPIVASDIPTSREIASKAAYFFKLDNEESFYEAVLNGIKDVNREARIQFIHRQLPQYYWNSLVPKYISAYQEVRRN